MIPCLVAVAFALAAQPPTVLMPKAVAPPTPEQVNAVPADLVKFLQTGDFDPNVARAGGTLVPPAAPTNALDGTVWVRDTKGCRVVVRFTKDGLVADLTTADGLALSVAGDYAVGKDGIVFGVVTRAESPGADGFELGAKLLAADGAPYCFRFRVEGAALSLRDFRCAAADATFAVLGTYRKTTAAELEKSPPVAKASGGR